MTENDLIPRLRFIGHHLERPGATPEEIVFSVTIAEAMEKIDRLRAALEKAADTFADFNKGLQLLNRPLLADACEIAEKASREALA